MGTNRQARPGNIGEVRDIVLSIGQTVLRSGGVVRSIANWGVFSLPRSVTAHQKTHVRGHYFVMRFDSTSATQTTMRNTLKLDPRMVRSAFVRLAGADGKLENTAKFGEVMWSQATGRA